ncbi:Uncharacterised protein [Yersinia enterocolitica]|nr:Uncharacterised protein [Yersinia enterocolitica]
MAKNALTTLGVNHIYKIYNMLFLDGTIITFSLNQA